MCKELGSEMMVEPRLMGGGDFWVIRDQAGAICALYRSPEKSQINLLNSSGRYDRVYLTARLSVELPSSTILFIGMDLVWNSIDLGELTKIIPGVIS